MRKKRKEKKNMTPRGLCHFVAVVCLQVPPAKSTPACNSSALLKTFLATRSMLHQCPEKNNNE